MTKTGKITLKTSAFGGYYLVQNAGGRGHSVTLRFLEATRPMLDSLAQNGNGYHAIKIERAAKFIPYCADHGIEVETVE